MFWIHKLFKRIECYQKENIFHFVISDVRFLHEATQLKEKGSVLIRINKETNLNDNHISENQISNIPETMINYTINNDSSLNNLKLQVETIMKDLFEIQDV